MLHLLEGNQFLSGGLVLGVLGTGVALLRSVPNKIFHFLKHRYISTLEVDSFDLSFPWLKKWLSEVSSNNKFTRLRPDVNYRNFDGKNLKIIPDFNISPSNGRVFLKYKGKRLSIRIDRKEKLDTASSTFLGYLESITISTLGRKRRLLLDILQDAYVLYNKEKQKQVCVHCFDGYGGWRLVNTKQFRDSSTLFYKSNIIEESKADIEKFFSKKEWYNSHGIPWRRGYLFYGEPGNGKSSLALYLASEFKTDVYVLNLSSLRSDEDLAKALTEIPKKTIVLLEDIDAVPCSRNQENSKNQITFSGLLNSLDGMLAVDGTILIMTSNYKDKIDNALIRPGRIDVKIYIGNADKDQAQRMFKHFFPDDSVDLSSFEENKYSIAHIQECILSSKTAQEAYNKCINI